MFFLLKIILLLCIILHSCFQASSIWCYNCLSPTITGFDCYNNPNRRKFERDCYRETDSNPHNNGDGMFVFQNRLLSTNKSRRVSERIRGDDQCVKFKAYKSGLEHVYRGCESSLFSDEDIVKIAEKGGMTKVRSIQRCDHDLCNSSRDSSATISKVFLSFIGSLVCILSHQL